jgi:superfamily I DNA and/or RNA helicase
MAVANCLFYSHQLTCASDEVGRRRLALETGGAFWTQQLRSGDPARGGLAWMGQVLDPSRPVVVCDSDTLAGLAEHASASGLVHEGEARVAVALATGLLRLGLRPSECAIISPFRAQLRRIAELLEEPTLPTAPSHPPAKSSSSLPSAQEHALRESLRAVDALTVDQSQGQDRVRVLRAHAAPPFFLPFRARAPRAGEQARSRATRCSPLAVGRACGAAPHARALF